MSARKLSAKAKQIIEAYPGPVKLLPSRSNIIGLVICGGALVCIGIYWFLHPIVPSAVVSQICIGVGLFFVGLTLFQKYSKVGLLTLDDKGLRIKRFWGAEMRKDWRELALITTYPAGVNDFLMYVEKDGVTTGGMKSGRRRPFGSNYGIKKEDLAAAIDLWRQRASTEPVKFE